MKVIVLGGGYCQLNMIKRLKEDGHYIVLIDYLIDNPGKEYADIHFRISTFDSQAVIGILKSEKADAIITMGTDQPVFTAASVAMEGDIPFYVEPDVAMAVTNKQVMKRKFSELGIPTADFRFIGEAFNDSELNGMKFPAVMKPVDSQGQRGIFCVDSIKEVRRYIEETISFSREDVVLIEEYYPNDEITVSGWVHEGHAHIISVIDRVTMEKDNRIGICIAHNYPSQHYLKYQNDIVNITQDIVAGFGIEDGPLYFQYLIGKRGVIVNEIAMRIGGAYEDITIPLYSGIDILGMVMDHTLGRKPDITALEKYNINENNTFISVQLFFIKPGKIKYITPAEELLAMECVKDVLYIIEEGSEMDDIKNATARAGYFIIKGTDFKDLSINVDMVFRKLQVLDENGNNLVIPYRDYREKYKFVNE